MNATLNMNLPSLIKTSPNFLEPASNSVVRLSNQIEGLLFLAEQICKHLDSFEQLHADGFNVHLEIEEFAIKINFELRDSELGIITLTSGLDHSQLAVDTILQNLEGGGPGIICFGDRQDAIDWICALVVRLGRIENFWQGAAIAAALEVRAKRLASTLR